MSQLERRLLENLPGLVMDRATKRGLQEIGRETAIAAFKGDAAAWLTLHNIKNASALIDAARELAGEDPAKAAMFAGYLKDYDSMVRRSQNLLGW